MNDFTQKGVFRWMSKLGQIVVLSLLWLLCCLPLITVIPACVALYDCAVVCLHGDEPHLYRQFFGTFKSHFLRRAGLSLLWSGITVLLTMGFRILSIMSQGNGFLQVYLILYAGSLLIPLSVLAWLIFMESQYAHGFLAQHKTALVFSIVHLPTTAAMLVILAVGAFVTLIMPIFLIITPAAIAAFHSHLAERIFEQHNPLLN